jgi:hypothetical protein
MNPKIISGSLDVETACPKICFASPAMAHAARIFRHSKDGRVNHQDWSKWAATELCTFPVSVIRTNLGRDIGFRCHRFHPCPTSRQSGSDRRNRATETGHSNALKSSFVFPCRFPHRRPSPVFSSAPFRLFGPSGTDCSASNTLFPALFLTVPLNQTKF